MLGPIIAWALAGPVQLDWSAPPQCPTRAAVQARVDGYLGDAPSELAVRVEATVTEHGDGWSLTLVTVDPQGRSRTRVVEDSDCEGLAEVTAVLSALAVAPKEPEVVTDPELETGSEPSGEETVPEAPRVTAPAPESEPVAPAVQPRVSLREPPSTPSKDARGSLRVGVRASGGLGMGWLPVGGDLGFATMVGRNGWAAELEVLLGLPRRVRLAEFGARGADLLGWAIAGRGCGVVTLARRLELPLCVGLEGGQVRGSPVGLDDPADAAPTWLAALLSPSLRLSAHRRIALWLMPEFQLGVVRPEFHTNAQRIQIFAASVASGRFRAGLEFTF